MTFECVRLGEIQLPINSYKHILQEKKKKRYVKTLRGINTKALIIIRKGSFLNWHDSWPDENENKPLPRYEPPSYSDVITSVGAMTKVGRQADRDTRLKLNSRQTGRQADSLA